MRADLERARRLPVSICYGHPAYWWRDTEGRHGSGDLEPTWFASRQADAFRPAWTGVVPSSVGWRPALRPGGDRRQVRQCYHDGLAALRHPRSVERASRDDMLALPVPLTLNQTPIHHAIGRSMASPPPAVTPPAGYVNGHANGIFPPPGYQHTDDHFVLTPDGAQVFANPVLGIEISDEFDGKSYVRRIQFEVVRGASDGARTNTVRHTIRSHDNRPRIPGEPC